MAFAVGRAVGPAVVRNRLRRRLRSLLAAAELPPGRYLVGARPAAAARTWVELSSDVGALASAVRRLEASTPPPASNVCSSTP